MVKIYFPNQENGASIFVIFSVFIFIKGIIGISFSSFFLYNYGEFNLLILFIILYFFKSFTFLIYKCFSPSKKKKSSAEIKRIEKSELSHNLKYIFLTSIIEIFVNLFLFQKINSRTTYFCPFYNCDLKFFYFLLTFLITPRLLEYNFYKQHYICLTIIGISSLISYIFLYHIVTNYISTFILIKIPLLALSEFLICIKEVTEKYMIKYNQVNIYLILSIQGVIQLIISGFILVIIFIIKGDLSVYMEDLLKQFLKDYLVVGFVYLILLIYEIIRIYINKKYTSYHVIIGENIAALSLLSLICLIISNKLSFLILIFCIIVLLTTFIMCDFIILDFGEQKRRSNLKDNNKKQLIEKDDLKKELNAI